jgi:hypothetical protein
MLVPQVKEKRIRNVRRTIRHLSTVLQKQPWNTFKHMADKMLIRL